MIPKGRAVPDEGIHEVDINSAPCAPDRLRPISILSVPWRVMMRCRASQVAIWQDPLLHEWQHGARHKHGTEQCIAQTYHLLESSLSGAVGCGPLHGLTIDISKCFDSIPLEAVQQAWIHAGLEPTCTLVVQHVEVTAKKIPSPQQYSWLCVRCEERTTPRGPDVNNCVQHCVCWTVPSTSSGGHSVGHRDSCLQLSRRHDRSGVSAFAIHLNDKKSYVFSTSEEVADHWRAHGSPINFAVTSTLHLLGTELSLRRSLPYAGSTTEEKVGKIHKRLRRVMLLPVAKSVKGSMIGNGCLSILGSCPVRPLPDQRAINSLRRFGLV
eukprot:6031204-Amphidinium_carterae.2